MGKNLMVSLWLATLMCCACSEHTIIMKWPTPKRCRSLVKTVSWISKDRSAVVLGKSDDPIQNCELTFGLESSPKHEKARLRVEYEVFYIHDCGVEVQINESSDSTFLHPDGNHLMIKSNCNTRKPGVLYAQPKNFVRIWWYKKDRLLEAYNFRLNISMIDGLPVVGPAFSTLVIVGLVTFLLVCLAATLFFKYLSHVSQSWHERSVETAMDRAICLYNSQEPLPEEPDHVCLQPGLRGERRQPARLRPREPEIAFVHRDGRVERFRPLASASSSCEQIGPHGARGEAEQARHAAVRVHQPHRARSQIATATSQVGACGVPPSDVPAHHKNQKRKRIDQGEGSSLSGCELPPTYEEAIQMPVAVIGSLKNEVASATPRPTNLGNSSPQLLTELGGQGTGEEESRQERQSSLEAIDYVNVATDGRRGPHTLGTEEEEEAALRESTSEAPLLPRDRDSPALASSSLQGEAQL